MVSNVPFHTCKNGFESICEEIKHRRHYFILQTNFLSFFLFVLLADYLGFFHSISLLCNFRSEKRMRIGHLNWESWMRFEKVFSVCCLVWYQLSKSKTMKSKNVNMQARTNLVEKNWNKLKKKEQNTYLIITAT